MEAVAALPLLAETAAEERTDMLTVILLGMLLRSAEMEAVADLRAHQRKQATEEMAVLAEMAVAAAVAAALQRAAEERTQILVMLAGTRLVRLVLAAPDLPVEPVETV